MAMAQAIAKAERGRKAKTATSAVSRGTLVIGLRTLWLVLAFINVAMFVISVPVRWHLLANPSVFTQVGLAHANIRTDFNATYNLAVEIMYALVFVTVALLIVW